MNTFVCPECKKELLQKDSAFECKHCQEKYSDVDRIPIFRNPEESAIWQFEKDDKAEKLIKSAEKDGWRKTIEEEYGNLKDSWIASQNRAEGIYLSNIDDQSIVLDAGCGWGALSFAVSSIAKEVYGIDSNNYGLRFVQLRCKQEGVNNAYFANSDIGKLPFPDDFFDLVILNGVWEWTPLAFPDISPEDAQKLILRELHRVLKPNGQIFIAIENRFGFRYLLGKPDEHTSVRFITVLPRFIAKLYFRIKTKTEYRIYTHSIKETEQLLKDSGFSETTFHATLPDYRFYKFIISLDNSNSYDLLLTMLKHISLSSRKYKMYYTLFKLFSFCGTSFLRKFTNAFIAIGKK